MKDDGLVVVGGSYAAVEIAASARDNGFDGRILLVSDETQPPYHRPPLSKGFLLGKVAESDLSLRSEAFYRQNDIELLLGTRVIEIDRHRRKIALADGTSIPYAKLALAMGSRPRPWLLSAPLDGLLTLRVLADARRIRDGLPDVAEVAIIGGGFIGLEIASALVQLGKRVTVIELQPRLLARAASAPLADFLADLHRAHGVELLLGRSVSAIGASGGRVRSVSSDGVTRPADLVVVGIGVEPNIEIAAASGLRCTDGIVVDGYTRTEDPSVFAAGDCTFHPNGHAGGAVRLECVQNAVDQARITGGLVGGRMKPYDAVPWFWSDQYDVKVQMVGLSRQHDCHVVCGSVESRRFSILYFKQDRLVAVDSVNRPADHMVGRKLIMSRTSLTPAQAQEPDFDLRRVIDGR